MQEIFGITDYIKSRAQDLADLGYVVVVPELYWRLGPNVTTDERTEAGLQEAFGYFGKLDVPNAVDDAVAALEYARTIPETGGKAGVLGFCLGGRLAYEVGVRSKPDVVVWRMAGGAKSEPAGLSIISASIHSRSVSSINPITSRRKSEQRHK